MLSEFSEAKIHTTVTVLPRSTDYVAMAPPLPHPLRVKLLLYTSVCFALGGVRGEATGVNSIGDDGHDGRLKRCSKHRVLLAEKHKQ